MSSIGQIGAGLAGLLGSAAVMTAAEGHTRLGRTRRRRSPSARVQRNWGKSRRVAEAIPDVAADLATGLAAGLGPFDALHYACRHRSDPLSLAARRACAMAEVGAPVRVALDVLSEVGADARLSSLRMALESELRSGGSALEPVTAVARAAAAEQTVRRTERAAKVAPLIQLVVALVLVPSALLLAAAVAVAGLPR